MKVILKYLVSKELWIGVVGSIIATIIISLFNKISVEGINTLFTFEFWKNVLTQPISLYVILIAVVIVSAVLFALRLNRRKPEFLKETTAIMGRFTWHWRWSYDEKEKEYDMYDFLPLCPKCGNELRMPYGGHTHDCINGHQYNIQNYLKLKAQIKSDLRTKYPDDADLIAMSPYIG